ncbi:MAG: energy-coupling factor transporter transmembrane protein EcfT [Propionibacteriaceae bacterium]|jgi:energy-coupling factor transport system permease protein|nr:energy-coupling factor transporter transmembrane protein EcfT [Propionibacteriaceae bacterium]
MSRLLTRPVDFARAAPAEEAPLDSGARPLSLIALALRRPVPPLVWWAWALSGAVVASLTTNVVLLTLIAAVMVATMLARRGTGPWARAVKAYLILAAVIVIIRVGLQMVLGSLRSGRVLFTLPEVHLPAWVQGIRLGGPVTLDGVALAFADAWRLAVMIICLGAANVLANPRGTLRAMPAVLHRVSTALAIAMAVAPQFIESAARIRRARRLRGGAGTGWRSVRGVLLPVVEDAVDRSISLAAGMEARGYGAHSSAGVTTPGTRVWATVSASTTRSGAQSGRSMTPVGRREEPITGNRGGDRSERMVPLVLVAGLLATIIGAFGLLGLPAARSLMWAVPLLVVGLAACFAALVVAGHQTHVTRYRPERIGPRDVVILVSALAVVGLAVALSRLIGGVMDPAVTPVTWPPFNVGFLVVAGLLAVPLLVTRAPDEGGVR